MVRIPAKRPSRTRLCLLLGVLVVLAGIYIPIHQRRVDSSLVNAIMEGDDARALGALRWGADPNATLAGMRTAAGGQPTAWEAWLRFFTGRRARRHAGVPALVMAARSGRTAVVKDLLSRGADPNAATASGMTALLYASQRRDVEPVRALLAAGANARARDRDGTSPILGAAHVGDPAVLGLLLDHGANIEDADPHQATPLMIAATTQRDQGVTYLLHRGADPTAPRRLGGSPLVWAASVGSTRILRAIWRPGSPTGTSPRELAAALYHAAKGQHLEACRCLLDWGAPVNGDPARWSAPAGGHARASMLSPQGTGPSVMRTLTTVVRRPAGGMLYVSRTAAVPGVTGATSAQPRTAIMRPPVRMVYTPPTDPPLIAAVEGGNQEVVQLLLERGADVNRPDFSGRSALVAACELRHIELAKLLVARGAHVKPTSAATFSPLVAAAGSGSEELVRLLLAHGADARAGDQQGDTPLHRAADNIKMAALLLDRGADPNARNSSGATPLLRAWLPETAETLLAHGADPNAADLQGMTPLMRAVEQANERMAQVLIRHGANVNARDVGGATVLGRLLSRGSFVPTQGSPTARLYDMLVRAGAKQSPAPPLTKGPTTPWPAQRPSRPTHP